MTVKEIEGKDYIRLHQLYTQLIENESEIGPMLKVLKEIQGDDHYALLGVYEGETLMGTVTLTRCLDLTGDARYYYSMENFVIDEAARGKGFGKALLQAAEKYIIDHNGSYVNFTSSSDRHEAHAFYEKMGYKKDYVEGFKKRF